MRERQNRAFLENFFTVDRFAWAVIGLAVSVAVGARAGAAGIVLETVSTLVRDPLHALFTRLLIYGAALVNGMGRAGLTGGLITFLVFAAIFILMTIERREHYYGLTAVPLIVIVYVASVFLAAGASGRIASMTSAGVFGIPSSTLQISGVFLISEAAIGLIVWSGAAGLLSLGVGVGLEYLASVGLIQYGGEEASAKVPRAGIVYYTERGFCPQCGEPYRSLPQTCIHCTADLAIGQETFECAYCGFSMCTRADRYCRKCAANLELHRQWEKGQVAATDRVAQSQAQADADAQAVAKAAEAEPSEPGQARVPKPAGDGPRDFIYCGKCGAEHPVGTHGKCECGKQVGMPLTELASHECPICFTPVARADAYCWFCGGELKKNL